MLKKTIKYQDFDGNDVTEDFYFNLNKAEIAEMELSMEGGWSEYLTRIVESKDGGEVMGAFKYLITTSVGRRSEDGRRFVKNQDIIDDFLQSNAYEAMFMEMITNTNAAVEFVTGVVPKDLAEGMNVDEVQAKVLEQPKEEDTRPAWERENRDPTKKELQEMSPEELREAFRRKSQ